MKEWEKRHYLFRVIEFFHLELLQKDCSLGKVPLKEAIKSVKAQIEVIETSTDCIIQCHEKELQRQL